MLHPCPRGQLPGTDGSGCRQAAISAAQAFDDSESVEEVKALLEETWPRTAMGILEISQAAFHEMSGHLCSWHLFGIAGEKYEQGNYLYPC